MSRRASALRDELLSLFRRGADAPLPSVEFDRLARSAFAVQFEGDPAYHAYCERRGADPFSVATWRDIPPVPARAFRDVAFASGPRGARSAVFLTSGTTAGSARRGAHHVPDLELYDASALAAFGRFLLPDGASCRFVSLIPSPLEAPDSSLSHMAGVVAGSFGQLGVGWFMHPSSGLDRAGLAAALEDAGAAGEPVLLLGTSLAFAAWLDELAAAGRRFALPDGSRLMDTGGSKGAKRSVPGQELRAAYGDLLGLPDHACVNEYGMTELCSQYYDRCLLDGIRGRGGPKASAPWLAALAADPETLAALPDGEPGVLRHVDLANLGSIVAVQTEDVGRVLDGHVELAGRAPGAEPRGCSLALELMLDAAE